jgi:hypothetical protein
MKIGLKNSLDIINNLELIVDFAVNEQCAALGECSTYNRLLALNKPVFHIEYPTPLNVQAARGISCTGAGVNGTSTILKNLQLNGETYYCDGSYVNTPTLGGTSPPRPSRPPPVPRPSTSRPGPTSRPSTTRRPSPPPNRPSSTQRPPTSTPGGGGNGGCRSKHWDQCGGNDWKGCTVCEVSLRSSKHECIAKFYVHCSHRTHARVCRRHITINVCSLSETVRGESIYIYRFSNFTYYHDRRVISLVIPYHYLTVSLSLPYDLTVAVRPWIIMFHGRYTTPQSSLTAPSPLLTAASIFETATTTTTSSWRLASSIQSTPPAHPHDRKPSPMLQEHQSLSRSEKKPQKHPLRQAGRPLSLPLRAWKMVSSISARRPRMCWPCKSFAQIVV